MHNILIFDRWQNCLIYTYCCSICTTVVSDVNIKYFGQSLKTTPRTWNKNTPVPCLRHNPGQNSRNLGEPLIKIYCLQKKSIHNPHASCAFKTLVDFSCIFHALCSKFLKFHQRIFSISWHFASRVWLCQSWSWSFYVLYLYWSITTSRTLN